MNPNAPVFVPSFASSCSSDISFSCSADSASSYQSQDQIVSSFDPSDLKILCSLFPEIDKSCLLSFLQMQPHLPSAVYDLLTMLDEADQPDTVAASSSSSSSSSYSSSSYSSSISSSTLCRFFPTRQCKLKNCPFLHALNRSALCRYWLHSSCNRGHDCLFLHSFDPVIAWVEEHKQVDPQAASSSRQGGEGQRQSPNECGDDDLSLDRGRTCVSGLTDLSVAPRQLDFLTPASSDSKVPMSSPAIPAGAGSASSALYSSSSSSSSAELSLASRLKLRLLQSQFPHVHAQIVAEMFASSGCLLEPAAQQLIARFGPPPLTTTTATPSSSSASSQPSSSSSSSTLNAKAAARPASRSQEVCVMCCVVSACAKYESERESTPVETHSSLCFLDLHVCPGKERAGGLTYT